MIDKAHELLPRKLAIAPADSRRSRLGSLDLAVAAFDALVAAGTWAFLARHLLGVQAPHRGVRQVCWLVVVALVVPISLRVSGAGLWARAGARWRSPLLLGGLLGAGASWLALRIAGGRAPLAAVAVWWFSLICLAGVVRIVVKGRLRRERVLLIGSGKAAQRFVETSNRHLGERVTFLGYVDDGSSPAAKLGLRRLGDLNSLSAVIQHERVDRVVVCFTRRSDEQLLDLIRASEELGVTVDIMPRFYELVGNHPQTYSLGYLPIVSLAVSSRSPAAAFCKRTIDVAVAIALLIVVAPVLAAIALAIALEDGPPVLFRQTRIGKDGAPFAVVKFRSMVAELSSDLLVEARELAARNTEVGEAVEALKTTLAPETTRVGRFLRRSSLDELPQLWNVVMGQMSLIGPRPLRQFEVDALHDWQRARLEVRPGMSGLWQVFGRSRIGWEERQQLDYAYARHASLRTDAEIAARTLPAVLRGKGAL